MEMISVDGAGAQASSWGRTVDDLAAGGHRVVAYDRRGYGRSTHPPVRDYRLHIADLAAVIEDAGAPAHVVGWSSGGNTALALATQRPELVRSLVVMEAPWHGLRGATPDLLGALGKAKIAQLRGRPRDAAIAFFRWASGLRDGGNGYDRIPRDGPDRADPAADHLAAGGGEPVLVRHAARPRAEGGALRPHRADPPRRAPRAHRGAGGVRRRGAAGGSAAERRLRADELVSPLVGHPEEFSQIT